eukprot:scaffold294_cov221-Amphora_coffeaeformis.AAC.56
MSCPGHLKEIHAVHQDTNRTCHPTNVKLISSKFHASAMVHQRTKISSSSCCQKHTSGAIRIQKSG